MRETALLESLHDLERQRRELREEKTTQYFRARAHLDYWIERRQFELGFYELTASFSEEPE